MTPEKPQEGRSEASPALQPIAEVRSYRDLQAALRDWCAKIRMTREELDDEAGLANGHSGKLLGAHAGKKFGEVSLGRVLAGTRSKLLLVVDDESLDWIEQRIAGHRNACEAQPQHRKHWRLKKGRGWGRVMAARRARKLSPERRSEIARHAAQARWQRVAATVAGEPAGRPPSP